MARRQPIRAFAPRQNTVGVQNNEETERKSLWTPPPSIQTLISKVDSLEERLDHLETTITTTSHHSLEDKRKENEEVEQSRKELKEMKEQLDEAMQKLQQREADLQATQETLDNLSNQTALDREKINALEVEKKELQQLVHDLEIKLNERVKKIERLERQVADMQRSLKNTDNTVASMQKQIQQIRQMQEQQMGNGIAAGSPAAGRASQQSVRAVSPRRHNLVSSVGNGQEGDRGAAPTRNPTSALGLPPIRVNGRGAGGVKFNFPPK